MKIRAFVANDYKTLPRIHEWTLIFNLKALVGLDRVYFV